LATLDTVPPTIQGLSAGANMQGPSRQSPAPACQQRRRRAGSEAPDLSAAPYQISEYSLKTERGARGPRATRHTSGHVAGPVAADVRIFLHLAQSAVVSDVLESLRGQAAVAAMIVKGCRTVDQLLLREQDHLVGLNGVKRLHHSHSAEGPATPAVPLVLDHAYAAGLAAALVAPVELQRHGLHREVDELVHGRVVGRGAVLQVPGE